LILWRTFFLFWVKDVFHGIIIEKHLGSSMNSVLTCNRLPRICTYRQFVVPNSSLAEKVYPLSSWLYCLQVAFRKLELVAQSQRSTSPSSTSQRSGRSSRVSQPLERTSKEISSAGSLGKDWSLCKETSQRVAVPPPPTEESKLRVTKGSSIWRFPLFRMVYRLVELVMIRISMASSSTWMATQRHLPRSKVLLKGAFTPIVVYAVLRKRELILR
jgi:hypothetical protein